MLSRKVIFLCLAVLPAANAGDWSLSELLNLLAQQEASTASFTETRQSGLLLEDAHLTGRLEYRRPDYLLREIKQPFSERFEVSGSRVTVTGPDRKPASFALQRFPLLNALVVSFRASLSGDRELLETHYQVELHGDADDWQLILVPRVKEVAEEIEQIKLSGRRGAIIGFALIEQDGDTTSMRISPDGDSQ